MKKLLLFVIPLLLILAIFQTSNASTSFITYEVAQIRDDGLVVKGSNGELFLINKDPGDIQVGDLIRYDSVRKRLRKSPWQKAKVLKMTGSAVTLQIANEKTVDINMRSRYRSEFKEGDEVHYNAAKGQIKKSNFANLNDE